MSKLWLRVRYGATLLAGVCSVLILTYEPVQAHAFGQSYTLPVPAWLFIYGGASAVFVSFAFIGYFVGEKNTTSGYRTKNISRWWVVRFFTHRLWLGLLRAFSVLLLIFTIVVGFWGTPDPTLNFAPTFFWVIFLLGMTYISALLGPVWDSLNPWRVLAQWWSSRWPLTGRLAYPEKFNYWPALVFYLVLVGAELLFSGAGAQPRFIASLLVEYSLVNLWGVYLFGYEWFRYGEVLSVIFRLLSKLAPLELRKGDLFARPPFVGALFSRPKYLSLLFLVLSLLATTAFDGLRSTTRWSDLIAFSHPLILWRGYDLYFWWEAGAFIVVLLLFIAVYFLFIALMRLLVRANKPVTGLAFEYAYTLLPIALAYNIAHYYQYFLTQGQALVSLLSDPFGWGWDLFGTVAFVPNPSLVPAAAGWYSQVLVIVIGHMASVYLAHRIALRLYGNRKSALISQLPMVVLMVGYTVLGLWILSQPLSLGG